MCCVLSGAEPDLGAPQALTQNCWLPLEGLPSSACHFVSQLCSADQESQVRRLHRANGARVVLP